LQLQEIARIQDLASQGLSVSAIRRETGYSRNTISKYLEHPIPAPAKRERTEPGKLDPYKDYIRARLATYDLNARRILADIRRMGYTGGYTLVKDFTQPLRQQRQIQAVYRFETGPGEQAQVDWFHCGLIEHDGKLRKCYAFVMVLGYSRYRFVRFTTDLHTTTFIRLHLEAFETFGGFPKHVLYDNLSSVVLERGWDRENRRWNTLMLDFATSLGFIPRLCAVGRAQTKGKVERSGRLVWDQFANGREFTSLEEMNREADVWARELNRERPNDATGRIPAELLREEKLTPLDPSRPYVISQAFDRKVTRECLVSYGGNRYSVPWQLVQRGEREAIVRVTGKMLTIEVAGQVVARHEIRSGTRQIVREKEHYAGLLQAIRSRNRDDEQRRVLNRMLDHVASRPLEEYDRLLEEVTS